MQRRSSLMFACKQGLSVTFKSSERASAKYHSWVGSRELGRTTFHSLPHQSEGGMSLFSKLFSLSHAVFLWHSYRSLFFDWLGSLFLWRMGSLSFYAFLSLAWYRTSSSFHGLSAWRRELLLGVGRKKKVEKKEHFWQWRVERPGWLSKSCRAVSLVKFPKKRSFINKSCRIPFGTMQC